MNHHILMKAKISSVEEDVIPAEPSGGKRKKKILIKKKKGSSKPKEQMSTPHHSTYQTFPETYETHPGEQHYYAEANDYPQARRADSPSRGQTTTYYVTEQPSDKDDGSEMSESQAYMDNNLEISSIADDDPQYTTTEGHEHTYLDMADKSKWKGKNLSYMTPQMLHAMKMSQTQSQLEYTKDMKRIQDQYNLDGCLSTLPEIEIAKRVSEQSSKKGYKDDYEKNKHDSIFSKVYTDVLEYKVAKDANNIISNYKYRKDWEDDKNVFYYPVTLTPQYENAVAAQQAASENLYRRRTDEDMSSIHYNPIETKQYENVKQQQSYISDAHYKAQYLKNRGKGFTPVLPPYQANLSRTLSAILSHKAYTAYARKLWEHYHLVVPIPQIAVAVETAKATSDKAYKAKFMTEIFSKSGRADIKCYPELLLARRVAGLVSKNAYKKEGGSFKLPYSIPVDAPEFIRAKQAAERSDIIYKKQRAEAITDYRGYQTMETKHHPVLKEKQRANDHSEIKYKEDWEYDKSYVYYPVHITPGYEALVKANEAKNDVFYKEEFSRSKDKNKYDVTDTQVYKTQKEVEEATCNTNYTQEYEKSKTNVSQVAETPEIKLFKELQPIQSKTKYGAKSKDMLKDVNIGPDLQEIAHAVSSQKILSKENYKKHYKDNLLGQGPHDPSMAYPEYQHMKEVVEKTNPTNYKKDAEQQKHCSQIPPDHPEFERAKRAARNLSDVEYQKQKQEAIQQHRGFQTLHPQDHPIVKRGQQAMELQSEKAYHEDWEYDKGVIYYPVHITPAYEAQSQLRQVQSEAKYKEGFERQKDKNAFDVTQTQQYQETSQLAKHTSEYKEDYEKNKHLLSQLEETPEMILSKNLHSIQSKKRYAEKSKEMQKIVTIGSDNQEITNAVTKQKLASHGEYKADFKKHVLGKAPQDITQAYPQYEHMRNISKQTNQKEYTKEAEKSKQHYNLPADYPLLVKARENAKNASDVEYQKQKAETIKAYRGFQTMDSKEHPVVQQAAKASALFSQQAYTEDWEAEKDLMYYPVHITPGYESQVEASKNQSDKKYKEEYDMEKEKNRFNVTETESYKNMKDTSLATSQVNYTKEFENSKSKTAPMEETNEMKLAKELRPVQSQKLYTTESKKMHQNVNIGPDLQGISHAVATQKMSSKDAYEAEYKQTMLGKAPHDVSVAYPEYEHMQKVSKDVSTTEYTKDAKKHAHHHNLPVDYPEFIRAKENAKNASDMEYKKDMRKVTDTYRGFQTMDSNDHPVVQQAMKAAQLSSEKAYKEDWEYDKTVVYYPVHITPGYEAMAEVKNVQSGATYKQNYENQKEKNAYVVTDTEQYKTMKEVNQAVSKKKYKEEHEKNKASIISLEETPEMKIAKELKSVQSKKLYSEDSKNAMKNVNIGLDVQEITHAVSTQKLASKDQYLDDYKRNVVGKAPDDVASAYPEYQLSKKATKLASKSEYKRDAEKSMHEHNLPLDYPEFVQAKENAKNASQIEYTKQRNETTQAYRGFQTMDSKEHPIVKQGIKAAELLSDKAYREDWEYDKTMIYYPVHLTPGYESQVEVGKVQSDVKYKEGFEKQKEKNAYTITDTEGYKNMKEVEAASSNVKYQEEHVKNKGKMLGVEVTPEMKLSKELHPIQSKKTYAEQSKSMQKNVHVGSDLQEISQAVNTQKQASDGLYKTEFKKMIGKGPHDPKQAYPEYKHLREVSKTNSKTEYEREAEKLRHHHNLPVDYPEFVQAKQNALNASDANYQKQKKEVINSYRGFQTMDSKDHPVVQQGIKAAELLSDKAYKEDWEHEKSYVYYPVHITPAYESQVEANKMLSDASYKGDLKKAASQGNKYNITETEGYKNLKESHQLTSDTAYRAEFEASKGKLISVKETPEMMLAKDLLSVQSKKMYSVDSKEMQKNVILGPESQEIDHAVEAQKLASKREYKASFKKNIIGKPPNDTSIAYPEYTHLKEVGKASSQSNYVKEAQDAMHTHNLPLDYPEFVRAKDNAKNASDIEYQKQHRHVIDSYRGFQTMDSKDHPIVQHGMKAAELISQKRYKEDWENDKDLIYYPVHITPAYEAVVEGSKALSDAKYKKGFEETKEKNRYMITDTEQYKEMKKNDEARSNIKYREGYEKMKTDYTDIEETPEMKLSKELKPILSKKAYAKHSKEIMKNVTIDADVQEISHALTTQRQQSTGKYKEEFAKEIHGKAPHDTSISYPEYDHHKEVGKLSSQNEYVKEAEKIKHQHNLPLDYPEFVRAKENALNASDINYQKQKKDVINEYRGFQTMDSKEHPIVQQGIKAAALMSEKAYKEDWEYDKDCIYYPVHITPGYEQAVEVSKIQSQAAYTKDGNTVKAKNTYRVTDTDLYKTAKNSASLSDRKYKEEYESTKGKSHTQIADTPEMVISRALRPLLSNKRYSDAAKSVMNKYSLDSSVQEIAHALYAQHFSSKAKYLEHYKKNILGKATTNPDAFPEYQHAKSISKLMSQNEYVKDADKIKHDHHLPLDYPEFVRAKENAKNASDMEYKKQRREVIDSYKGFQTMDSKDHPVVQQGIKAAELMSDRAYKEDWEYDKNCIYYPVHITPGYEQAIEVGKIQSDVAYKKHHSADKSSNKYTVTDTEAYKTMKNAAKQSDHEYKKEHLLNKGKGHTQVKVTPEMVISQSIQPFLSEKWYSDAARKTMQEYNLDSSVQGIAHAVHTQKAVSDLPYLDDFKRNIVGKSRQDPANSYPEYHHAKRVSNLTSKKEYLKDAESIMHTHHLPLDYPVFVNARQVAKNASDAEYKKQLKSVINSYRGFQTMDSTEHPVVVQGIRAADLLSEKKYKEDYMADRDLIYYPVHITPGYEAAVSASKYGSETEYKRKGEIENEKNKYIYTETERYKTDKVLDDLKEYNYKHPAKKFTAMAVTPDMEMSKLVQGILSDSHYTKQAKKMFDKYDLNTNDQKLAHALSVSEKTSPNNYVKEFKDNMIGRTVANTSIAYPEYEHFKAVSKMTSKNAYVKDAEKMLHHHNLPLDYPEFVRAKESAINSSDIHYQRQRQEVIDSYRGFQTMNSKEHPVVQQGIKAADLMSDIKYKEDYMIDRNIIYYPVHLTPGYESAMNVTKYQSNALYKEKHNKTKANVKFNPAETEMYQTAKETQLAVNEINYKDDARQKMAKEFTQIETTPEMIMSKRIQPLLSHKIYAEQAKKMLNKYNLDAGIPEIAQALFATQMQSKKRYREQYEMEQVGSAPHNVGLSYPECDHVKRVSSLISKKNYVKDGEELQHHYTMPADILELSRAKEATENASDVKYKKQLQEVNEKYRGFQTMEPKDHPSVQQHQRASDHSDLKYKEDYMLEKSFIYFPVHLTPGYEVMQSQKAHSEAVYKQKHNDEKSGNHFDVTQTEQYQVEQLLKKFTDDQIYKKDLENMTTEFTSLPDSVQQVHLNAVKRMASQKQYTDSAKQSLDKYNIDASDFQISHALAMAAVSSPVAYRDNYKKSMIGMPRSKQDLEVYPEYVNAEKVSKQSSKVQYTKDGESTRHQFTLPVDMPEIELAKTAAKNASDLIYKKQRAEVIASYRGFQTMDSKNHPVVQQGIKAADLISNIKYKEDYMVDRNLIYYPVHITPGYEAVAKASQFNSDVKYQKSAKRDLGDVHYNVTMTDAYKDMKEMGKLSDHMYKEEASKGSFTPIADAPETKHAKAVQDLTSYSFYKSKAKKMMDKYNLTVDDQHTTHALFASKLFSNVLYKMEYDNVIKGKTVAIDMESYPEYQQAMKASKNLSQVEYQKMAEELKHLYSLPVDMPSITHARSVAAMQSNINYVKSRQEVIDTFRGFQTMDSKSHPVVQHGIKAADLISERKYKEDYLADRNLIYYPVHLTPGYEAYTSASKFASDADYKKSYRNNLSKYHNFPVEQTPTYQSAKQHDKLTNPVNYKQKNEHFTQVPDLHETRILKEVQPMISQKFYKEKAKELLGKYHLTAEIPEIAHALYVTDILSPAAYRSKYVKDLKGKGADGLEKSEYFAQIKKASNLTSNTSYTKDAKHARNFYTIDGEMPSLEQAKIASKQASDIEYKKGALGERQKGSLYHRMPMKEVPAYEKAHQNAVNLSDIKYKEDYNDMKKYVYFPYHITPQYEKYLQASKLLTPSEYTKEMKNNLKLLNYDYTKIPGYLHQKALDDVISSHKDKAALQELHSKGFTPIPDDIYQDHAQAAQKRISTNLYKLAARRVLDQYHIDAELPEIKMANAASKLSSQNIYKAEFEKAKGTAGKLGLDMPMFQQAKRMKDLVSDNVYRQKAEQEKHLFTACPDRPDFIHAKEVDHNISNILYKQKGKEESAKCQAYQHLRARDHRDVAHAIKVADLISDTKYKEEYNELRNIIYFPVHLTTGYETAVNANKFASDATYKAKWKANRFKNSFKVNETEMYKHDRSMHEKISDIAYKAKYRAEVGKCPYITETPSFSHQRDMKSLFSENLYRSDAKKIMDKYNLVSDEPRIKQALYATALASEKAYRNAYEQQKGQGTTNLHETPLMKHQLQATVLRSEKPYRNSAKKLLESVRIPDDTNEIKHAKSVGKLVSNLVYKAEGGKNDLHGYKKLQINEDFTQKHLEEQKDIHSEVNYKKEFMEQKGHNIPVAETPDTVRVKKQQKIVSDAIYKKDVEREIKGHGLTTESTPQILHAKHATEIQSEQKYKTGLENISQWKSGEAMNTPIARKACQNKDLISQHKYREAYDNLKGSGCDVVTPAMSFAQDVTKLTSENKYKEKYNESKGETRYSTMESTPQTEHAREVNAKISDRLYKEQHQKEDVGKSSELKDSVLIQSNLKTTELQSNLKYAKQLAEAIEQYKGYFENIIDTPSIKHVQKVRDQLSEAKYREDYESEKSVIYFPYFVTPQYESQKKANEILSNNIYKSKAKKEKANFTLPSDMPSLVHAREVNELLSDINYKKAYEEEKGAGMMLTGFDDLPQLLHSKNMQRLFSDNTYKSKSKKILDKYHLDVSTPQILNAKRANNLVSKNQYKAAYEKEKGQPYSIADSVEMRHLKKLPEQNSEIKYKQDLILSRGNVIQVPDTPWMISFQQAQDYVSNNKYGKKRWDFKSQYQPEVFNTHIKKVTGNISDLSYREDFDEYFKGNLIPIPDHPLVLKALRNSELISKKKYKDKAVKDHQHYILVPDTPQYKTIRDAAKYLSDITYKEDGAKTRNQFTLPADLPVFKHARDAQILTSENAYAKDAKSRMAKEYIIPPEGTPTMKQQKIASGLASNRDYKEKGEEIKHLPRAYNTLQETRDTKHAKEMGRLVSDVSYKSSAKKELQHIHPSAETPWLQKAKEVMTNISETQYKAKDKDLLHSYKMKDGDDRFIKHALEVRDKISDVKYKEKYLEDVGICWCLPSDRTIDHAKKAHELASTNEYKRKAKALKGKYHITTDTPEFERLRKLRDELSENQYRDEVKKFTVLAATPELKHATRVSLLVSKNKYKEDHEKEKGKYILLKDDPKIAHDQQVNKQCSDISYKKDVEKMKKDGFTFLPDAPDLEHQKKVQKNVSNSEYRREGKEHNNFTVLEDSPDVKHAMETAKMQSNVKYRQKPEAKDIAVLDTPHMQHVMNANNLQSDLKYRAAYTNRLRKKGWHFIRDTLSQKHVENIGKVQSDYKYRKDYKENVGKGFTTITDRPDIVHATNMKEMVSDNEYKRKHREMTGKGYTFVADNPTITHAEEANILQSEVQYKKNYDKTKGKGWQTEDSQMHGHYKEAQKLVGNVGYKKDAQSLNARGTSAFLELTPTELHHRRAAEILDNKKYKSDYERNIRGRGMMMDMVNTPSMDHIRHAEDIKSDVRYRAKYQENVVGKPTNSIVDAPDILQAQHATSIASDNKYKADYQNNIRGKAHSLAFTPEMTRLREAQKFVSHNHYKSNNGGKVSQYSNPILDTPEWRMVKQNTRNFSKVHYKDTSSVGRSVSVLDTPELRTARRNKHNFSQIKYQEDREKLKGKATQVVDDPSTRRAMQAAKIASDIEYKKSKEKTEEMERKRQDINTTSQKSASHASLVKSHVAPTRHPGLMQSNIIHHGPLKRWRRQPGSIFDYDPSDYETEQEYESRLVTKKHDDAYKLYHTDTEADFVSAYNFQPKKNIVSWREYPSGKAYKHVAAPGNIADYDPAKQMERMSMKDKEPEIVSTSPQPTEQVQDPSPEPEPVTAPEAVSDEQDQEIFEEFVRKSDGHIYKAMFDYVAQDDDEVSFQDGDTIINAQRIDDGWMFGTVERTAQTGMLPSNYVQVIQ